MYLVRSRCAPTTVGHCHPNQWVHSFRVRNNDRSGMESMATQTLPEAGQTQDTFPINGTDYIEFYVGNAKQAAHYYQSAFGFQTLAYRGPETGVRDRASFLMAQGKIRFVVTTPMSGAGSIAEHVRKH